jgi:hypothetical protein
MVDGELARAHYLSIRPELDLRSGMLSEHPVVNLR